MTYFPLHQTTCFFIPLVAPCKPLLAFAKYSYSQLKWVLLEKPALREAYARGKINEELDAVLTEANATFDRFAERYIIVFN